MTVLLLLSVCVVSRATAAANPPFSITVNGAKIGINEAGGAAPDTEKAIADELASEPEDLYAESAADRRAKEAIIHDKEARKADAARARTADYKRKAIALEHQLEADKQMHDKQLAAEKEKTREEERVLAAHDASLKAQLRKEEQHIKDIIQAEDEEAAEEEQAQIEEQAARKKEQQLKRKEVNDMS
ncbi:unnamed protein product [Vitrella brassicaformis CCMP3155]|uniref:ATPase family AAA domain-containing protein n=1 Tax=Vitrella brassicaformis (strain CCMP3155) TaxID=1169540 RepID=A0A0G4ELL9_VITBC|nr:unnamed protein product [Vitrella brassicaformis CCMP3155]|eukprot:CEL97723.1 unnamed protein product [Vitrella brassicaformis CCMP3155]